MFVPEPTMNTAIYTQIDRHHKHIAGIPVCWFLPIFARTTHTYKQTAGIKVKAYRRRLRHRRRQCCVGWVLSRLWGIHTQFEYVANVKVFVQIFCMCSVYIHLHGTFGVPSIAHSNCVRPDAHQPFGLKINNIDDGDCDIAQTLLSFVHMWPTLSSNSIVYLLCVCILLRQMGGVGNGGNVKAKVRKPTRGGRAQKNVGRPREYVIWRTIFSFHFPVLRLQCNVTVVLCIICM